MIAFIDDHRGAYGVEPICKVLPIGSFEAVEFATLAWVDWFNHRRLLEPTGNIPPAEAKNATTLCWTSQRWQPDPNQTACGKTGAVQS